MPDTTIILTDHTLWDYRALTDAGLDPADTQAREHKVPCTTCGKDTRNLAAGCDWHYIAPFKARGAR